MGALMSVDAVRPTVPTGDYHSDDLQVPNEITLPTSFSRAPSGKSVEQNSRENLASQGQSDSRGRYRDHRQGNFLIILSG
jgi:hypothetical protein